MVLKWLFGEEDKNNPNQAQQPKQPQTYEEIPGVDYLELQVLIQKYGEVAGYVYQLRDKYMIWDDGPASVRSPQHARKHAEAKEIRKQYPDFFQKDPLRLLTLDEYLSNVNRQKSLKMSLSSIATPPYPGQRAILGMVIPFKGDIQGLTFDKDWDPIITNSEETYRLKNALAPYIIYSNLQNHTARARIYRIDGVYEVIIQLNTAYNYNVPTATYELGQLMSGSLGVSIDMNMGPGVSQYFDPSAEFGES